jgi:hypothetical protein
LRRNCFLKVIEGKIEEKIDGTEKRGRKLKEGNILEIEGGSTRSHSLEDWLWKRLRTCRKRDYVMMMMTMMIMTTKKLRKMRNLLPCGVSKDISENIP